MQRKALLKVMKKNEVQQTLSEIKDMMAKSSRFQAVSGISIIIVGIYACIACIAGYIIIGAPDALPFLPKSWADFSLNTPYRIKLACLLSAVLFAVAFLTVVLMAWRKSKKHQLRFTFDKRMMQMIFNFLLPLAIGGLLCLALIFQGHYGLTSSIMLLFYGLALVNCQHYTYPVMRFLGYGEIILGIFDCFSIHHALLFWFLGFGILHILFGIFYTLKYEKAK